MDNHIAQTMTLLTQARSGDKYALELLLSRYSEKILRIVRLRLAKDLREKMDSMDVFQDVMLRVINSLEKFEPENEASFLNWLSVLVRNEIRDKTDHFRAAKRDFKKEITNQANHTAECSVFNAIPAPSNEGPLRLTDLIENIHRLESAMDQLSETHREIVIMRQYEGFSYPEIGSRLNLSEDAVRMQYGRAMAKLADYLAE